ncbi:MAG: coenzyme F420-0:L-glutamate ligase [Nitriliruptorales bacterium]|nr:coenzyme F420-0:L-glutamate ligase [Nitriliruptorales bacterium]
MTLWIIPLPTAARFQAGDELSGPLLSAFADAGIEPADGDIVCVASKVVSKVEGRLVPLPDAVDVHQARRILAKQEAARIVADGPQVLIVETHHGLVCANAGIDTSNVTDGMALLLPEDPDASAERLRARLRAASGVDVGVVITDTFGRPWRLGQTDVAIGAAGLEVLRDERGTTDLDGRVLEVTMVAVADEIAAAADLVRRKADGVPFVLLRGLDATGEGTAADLVRPPEEDLFRHGAATSEGPPS